MQDNKAVNLPLVRRLEAVSFRAWPASNERRFLYSSAMPAMLPRDSKDHNTGV